jgi:hypothetical protein
MKASAILFSLMAAFFSSLASNATASDSIGIVKSMDGEVFLVGPHRTLSAAPNMKIRQGDTIKTGATSSAGLIFHDDTVVSLGPNSELAIENFQFNPADRELSFVSRLLKGTFCFITGQIAKLAPNKVKFETPEATLGVRGTKFLVKID